MLIVAALLASILAGGEREGRVCVAPLPQDVSRADRDLAGGKPQKREPQYKFTVAIDGGTPVRIDEGAGPRSIGGLVSGRRHRVVIRDDGETIESFWFTFEAKGSDDLCLAYTPWYQTWQLDPPRPGAKWCRCEAGPSPAVP